MQAPQKGGPVPNAYEINPMMMEALDQITPQTLPMMLMSNPQMVPQKHAKAIKKAAKNLGTYAFGGIFAGSMLNILIKKVYIQFLAFPLYTRIPLRLSVFAIPFCLLQGKFYENIQLIGENMATIHMKLRRLRKTGNIEEYFRP